VIGAAALLLLGATACGGGDGGDDGNGTKGSGNDGPVQITLQEWAVLAEPARATAGEVTFDISNEGEEIHEFVILKTDLGLLDLPTAEDGSVDEEGGEIEVVDEVEDIPSGDTAELTVDLEAGDYVILCNIVEEEGHDDHEAHFEMGMRTSFTVQ
jgi:uncharacterized cupredoxin-like copper-binding protein